MKHAIRLTEFSVYLYQLISEECTVVLMIRPTHSSAGPGGGGGHVTPQISTRQQTAETVIGGE
jgi:hypothetical protein